MVVVVACVWGGGELTTTSLQPTLTPSQRSSKSGVQPPEPSSTEGMVRRRMCVMRYVKTGGAPWRRSWMLAGQGDASRALIPPIPHTQRARSTHLFVVVHPTDLARDGDALAVGRPRVAVEAQRRLGRRSEAAVEDVGGEEEARAALARLGDARGAAAGVTRARRRSSPAPERPPPTLQCTATTFSECSESHASTSLQRRGSPFSSPPAQAHAQRRGDGTRLQKTGMSSSGGGLWSSNG